MVLLPIVFLIIDLLTRDTGDRASGAQDQEHPSIHVCFKSFIHFKIQHIFSEQSLCCRELRLESVDTDRNRLRVALPPKTHILPRKSREQTEIIIVIAGKKINQGVSMTGSGRPLSLSSVWFLSGRAEVGEGRRQPCDTPREKI